MKLLIGKRQNSGITLTEGSINSEDLDSEDELVRRIYSEFGEGYYTVTYKPYKYFQKLWQGQIERVEKREIGRDRIKYFRDFSDLELEAGIDENKDTEGNEWTEIF